MLFNKLKFHKKIVLVIALGVAGIMSANTIIVDLNLEDKAVDNSSKIVLSNTFAGYTTSCGWPSFSCENSFVEILNEIARFDNELCV
ncbi:hypothetical protein [Soonwooa sp.]|uniref:hypothetical protein n=1 Tax=Soonwooa sp. TaxID=1938592 RepID=UPI002622D55F|nr:hypothetical protein [Soonwooa sp.]